MKITFYLFTAGLLTCPSPGFAALSNYWPLEGTSGTTATNTVAGAAPGALFAGADWVTDATRGQVLEFNGAGGYVAAGVLPELAPETSFTWAFWANSGVNADPAVTVLGNRTPDTGWTKFTPGTFEFQDGGGTLSTIDYADFAEDVWTHHATVKNGGLFTYYRNGLALSYVWGGAGGTLLAGTPLYFGGDTVNESWAGRLDEVATWTNALPAASVAGLAAGTYKPDAAPLTHAPALTEVLADDFSGDLAKWTITNRGLENNAAAGYTAPSVAGGVLTLAGTTNNSYWFGSSLESVTAFDSRLYTEVSVKRTELAGSGTAYRSSLWIFGDAGHYLHFSQNIGEGGWSWNALDTGGIDTANATGSGTNLTGLDELDADTAEQTLSIRIIPAGPSGSVNMELLVNGTVYGVRGFTAFPSTFRVILTGQARQANDTVSASFDDVRVARETVSNLPPAFTAPAVYLDSATPGTAYAATLAGAATDPDNDPLTFTKTTGPAWLTVSPQGAVSGTPPAGELSAQAEIFASDGRGGTAVTTVNLRIAGPAAPAPALFGWWPLNQTGGTIAAEATGAAGGANSATITNAAGGLGAGGSVWRTDATFGPVLTSNGTDGSGASAVVGAPPDAGLLPVFDAATDFSWAFWAKPSQVANNDIILGNRYDPGNVDYVPLQFVKFTSSQFEWYYEGQQQGIDYPDLAPDVWAHHAVVKKGDTLFYYRNGALAGLRPGLTVFPDQPLPLYFSGQNGVEVWSGSLHDVRLFSGALSDADLTAVVQSRGQFPVTAPAFTSSLIALPDAAPGAPYSQNLASFATDPQAGPLTFTLTGGSPWLTLTPQGVLSGTPDATPPLLGEATVTVKDNQNLTAGAVFRFRIGNPAAPVPPLFGWWPLNEGAGDQALDTGGAGNTAIITNAETGGLGAGGAAWVSDAERGNVLTFNGTDGAGTWASAGDPAAPVLLPLLDLESDFTWSFHAKPDQLPDTAVILGNRYDPGGLDYEPRQFVKFTSLSFEWHVNGAGQDLNYPDLEPGVWAHHTVVKDGETLYYYRNGALVMASAITGAPDLQMPLYFGAQGPTGVEAWRGSLSDVRLFNGALSSVSVDALARGQLNPPPASGLRITNITRAADGSVTLQWNAEAGKTYTVSASKTLTGVWPVLSSTATVTYTLPAGNATFNPAVEPRLFFRVTENP